MTDEETLSRMLERAAVGFSRRPRATSRFGQPPTATGRRGQIITVNGFDAVAEFIFDGEGALIDLMVTQ